MSLAQLVNVAHAALTEGLDEDGMQRMDRVLMGEKVEAPTREEAFMRGRQQPVSWQRQQAASGPPAPPPGVPLAPVGVRVREPEPTRGLDVLHAALGVAPKPPPKPRARGG
jgi:hypothetical protein